MFNIFIMELRADIYFEGILACRIDVKSGYNVNTGSLYAIG